MTTHQNEVHFHRVSERTPGWIWQALYAAQKDARSSSLPVIIELNDFNELLAATASQREEASA